MFLCNVNIMLLHNYVFAYCKHYAFMLICFYAKHASFCPFKNLLR